jgi:hypothetical protein
MGFVQVADTPELPVDLEGEQPKDRAFAIPSSK